jgi:7-cyano-7-deazaguanine synthase
MEKAVVLLSGGLDSAVNLKCCLEEFSVQRVLTFDYGQKARLREMEAASAMCRRYHLRHSVLELPWLKKISDSALTKQSVRIPKVTPETLDVPAAAKKSADAVWVPNRNGAFINIAASFAEGLGASRIVTGFNCEEGRTFPDNSEPFIRAANAALRISCLEKVAVMSFTSRMKKDAIVRLGMEKDAPLDLVWCCYGGAKFLCLKCESCLRARRAFEKTDSWDWFKKHNRYVR